MQVRYTIQFPKEELSGTEQAEAYFYLHDESGLRKIRFHDYPVIYKMPGLYEQVFYDRLRCASPIKMASLLNAVVSQFQKRIAELRVLDFGAGNGMMGQALNKYGVSRLIGVDIFPEACEAALRDRAGLYDAYYIEDFTELSDAGRQEIKSWRCNCMVTVGALGFGDIPIKAFLEAFNILQTPGWIAFNIKETFLKKQDASGYSNMVKSLLCSEYFDVYHIERYRHRLSIDGHPLYYLGIVGRKRADISPSFLSALDVRLS